MSRLIYRVKGKDEKEDIWKGRRLGGLGRVCFERTLPGIPTGTIYLFVFFNKKMSLASEVLCFAILR